jgi:4-hydroxythreonine-4-phosphate dehydrogenase
MTSSPEYRMCLFAGKLRIIHITSHMSLQDAIHAVTAERIATSIRIGRQGLEKLGITNPRIAVAGLNPHAGEAGAFGMEEAREIIPAIEQCRQQAIDCSGPYPADTVFRRAWQGEFDLVIAMYHDQGHSPAKLVAMDEGVNVTLGIPIIRTSVDHGTAYDIAWKGVAREHSLRAAIVLAVQFAEGRAGGT